MNKKEVKEAKQLYDEFYKKFTKNELMHIVLALLFSNVSSDKKRLLESYLKEVKK